MTLKADWNNGEYILKKQLIANHDGNWLIPAHQWVKEADGALTDGAEHRSVKWLWTRRQETMLKFQTRVQIVRRGLTIMMQSEIHHPWEYPIMKSDNSQLVSLTSLTRSQRGRGMLEPFIEEIRKIVLKVPTHKTRVSAIIKLSVGKWRGIVF